MSAKAVRRDRKSAASSQGIISADALNYEHRRYSLLQETSVRFPDAAALPARHPQAAPADPRTSGRCADAVLDRDPRLSAVASGEDDGAGSVILGPRPADPDLRPMRRRHSAPETLELFAIASARITARKRHPRAAPYAGHAITVILGPADPRTLCRHADAILVLRSSGLRSARPEDDVSRSAP